MASMKSNNIDFVRTQINKIFTTTFIRDHLTNKVAATRVTWDNKQSTAGYKSYNIQKVVFPFLTSGYTKLRRRSSLFKSSVEKKPESATPTSPLQELYKTVYLLSLEEKKFKEEFLSQEDCDTLLQNCNTEKSKAKKVAEFLHNFIDSTMKLVAETQFPVDTKEYGNKSSTNYSLFSVYQDGAGIVQNKLETIQNLFPNFLQAYLGEAADKAQEKTTENSKKSNKNNNRSEKPSEVNTSKKSRRRKPKPKTQNTTDDKHINDMTSGKITAKNKDKDPESRREVTTVKSFRSFVSDDQKEDKDKTP